MKEREVWVDNVKVVACILVVLGHFFQSMIKSGILYETDLFLWFNKTIYYFHVPLFFICSGYLYQKLSKVESRSSWRRNVKKKALVLGIPYVTFSVATWMLQVIFSASINSKVRGLLDTLFFHPSSPYWYFYILFFMFLVTPTFRTRKYVATGLCAAFLLKFFAFFGHMGFELPYVITNLFQYEIWFVIGMWLSCIGFNRVLKERKRLYFGISCWMGALFFIFSILAYVFDLTYCAMDFVLGLGACSAVILFMGSKYADNKQTTWFGFLANYTLPIFVMHTLFAAAIRIAFMKLGIGNALIHVAAGIGSSVIGPIIAAQIMARVRWMEFFLYPGKVIGINQSK